MTVVLFGIVYAAVLVFAAASAARIVEYARAPLHLRWELYPVPHEESERVAHGGSYYEDVDWWTRRRTFHVLTEWTFMAREIVLLYALREFNRRLWRRSFPFHFGLYLLIGTFGLFVCAAAGDVVSPGFAGHGLGALLAALSRITGWAGIGLVILGALALLHRRVTDEDLKPYTTPGDIANLLFFVAAFGTLGVGALASGSVSGVSFVRAVLTADPGVAVSPGLAAGIALTAVLVAYIPLTHMSHFIAKYFTYHAVRWDDAPNQRNGRIEAKIAEYLTYRPTWSARHMRADGTKTWADIATTNPTEGTGK
jgi:nitrate reductase gamma subunit